MFTYIQIHLYFIIPPIIILTLLYYPVLGRRDILKFLWLGFMATIWTTPWDNFILSQGGWTYPKGSILGKIGYVPIEEHMFFILQPILVILSHSIITHSRLLPFDVNLSINNEISQRHARTINNRQRIEKLQEEEPVVGKKLDGLNEKSPLIQKSPNYQQYIQTLPRRPLAAISWIALSLIGLRLILKTNQYVAIDYGLKSHMFYLGWILVWICPVISFLSFIGARLTWTDWWALWIGTGWLWMVDTIALRSGSWSISRHTTLGVELWSGLPLEEAIFFLLTTYLILLSSSLISHLHTLQILSPDLPPCPPVNPISHITLLAKIAYNPPKIDKRILIGLKEAEKTLKKGSKSFEIAKLAFGREMRLGLVVIYAWCRVTDNLIDEPFPAGSETASSESLDLARSKILESIRQHINVTYELYAKYRIRNYPIEEIDLILDSIPNLTTSDRSAFHLFSLIIPRLVPKYPFLELCDGYSTDLKFPSKPIPKILDAIAGNNDITEHLPIKTTADLLKYADDVAGSIASSICYLSWSILDSDSVNPVEDYHFAEDLHTKKTTFENNAQPNETDLELSKRLRIIKSSREMGRSLQLVNISRDIIKDALISRLYVPISFFDSPNEIISVLFRHPQSPIKISYSKYTSKLISIASEMRDNSIEAIEELPKTSRGGIRSMVSSYFEIAYAIQENNGEIDEYGIKVNKLVRMGRAAKAMWIGK